MLYRGFKQVSTTSYVERVDSIDASTFICAPDSVALSEVSAQYSIELSDLTVVTSESDPREGTLLHATISWNDQTRNARNALLANSDWTQANDSPLSSSKKDEWKTYRQSLRDLPVNQTDVTKMTWPTEPS